MNHTKLSEKLIASYVQENENKRMLWFWMMKRWYDVVIGIIVLIGSIMFLVWVISKWL